MIAANIGTKNNLLANKDSLCFIVAIQEPWCITIDMTKQVTIKADEATAQKLATLKGLTGISMQALVGRAVDNMIKQLKTTGVLDVDMSKGFKR